MESILLKKLEVSYSCPVCGNPFIWEDDDDPNDDQECTWCDTELTFSEFVKEYEFFEFE